MPNRHPFYTFPEHESEGGVSVLEQIGEPGSSGSDYRVILYNDNDHGIEEVIEQVMKATECDVEEAVKIVVEVDRKGRGICFRGDRAKCHKVAKVLREIRLQCEVDCD